MEYKIPQETIDILIESHAAAKLRDRYVMLRYFGGGHRLALKAAIRSERYSREFWDQVAELYPETEGKKLSFDHTRKLVSEV
jgi:hypothetical protein